MATPQAREQLVIFLQNHKGPNSKTLTLIYRLKWLWKFNINLKFLPSKDQGTTLVPARNCGSDSHHSAANKHYSVGGSKSPRLTHTELNATCRVPGTEVRLPEPEKDNPTACSPLTTATTTFRKRSFYDFKSEASNAVGSPPGCEEKPPREREARPEGPCSEVTCLQARTCTRVPRAKNWTEVNLNILLMYFYCFINTKKN